MTHLSESVREPRTKVPFLYSVGQLMYVEGKAATITARDHRAWRPEPIYRLEGEDGTELKKKWYRESEL